MKKSIKKMIATAFVSLFALQTVMVSPANAASTILADIDFFGVDRTFDVKLYKNNSSPDSYGYLDVVALGSPGYIYTYDLTYFYANTKSKVIGTQVWNFYMKVDSNSHAGVNAITLKDNNDNIIKRVYPQKFIDINDGLTYSFTTNLVDYDLDYDGQVTLTDAQLANKFALAIASPSDLQILLGDNNGNGSIDSSDSQYILKVALGMV